MFFILFISYKLSVKEYFYVATKIYTLTKSLVLIKIIKFCVFFFLNYMAKATSTIVIQFLYALIQSTKTVLRHGYLKIINRIRLLLLTQEISLDVNHVGIIKHK